MAVRWTQLPGRELGLIGLACAFVVAMLADQLVVRPALTRLARLSVDRGIALEQRRHNQALLQLEKPVAAEYGKVQDLIGAVAAEADGIEELKSQLDALASRTGLRLLAMRHLAPARTEFLVTYQIDIGEFAGETVNLLNFLHALHEAPGMLRTARLTVSASDESSAVRGSMLITKVMTISENANAPLPEG